MNIDSNYDFRNRSRNPITSLLGRFSYHTYIRTPISHVLQSSSLTQFTSLQSSCVVASARALAEACTCDTPLGIVLSSLVCVTDVAKEQ